MISKEEFELLQNKLVQISEEKEQYEKKAQELTKENEQIPLLRQKVDELEKQNEKDETNQMNELRDATQELNQVRNELSNLKDPKDNRKMKKMEAQLETLQEKTRKLDEQLQELDKTDKSNTEIETPLDEQISAFQKHLDVLAAYQHRIPRASRIIMYINDLEQKRDQLYEDVKNLQQKIPLLEEQVSESETKKLNLMSELRKITSEIDTVNENVKNGDTQHIDCYKLLNQVSIKLQEVNDASRAEKAKMAQLQTKYSEEKQNAINEGKELEREIEDLKKQIEEFPAKKKQEISDIEMKIAKTKQMAEQLERKKEEIKTDIQKKLSESSIVSDLTKLMEKEWVEHQKLLDEKNKVQAQLDRASEDLRRKKVASEEIEKRWPKSSKPIKGPGMPELEYMYEQALHQNRQLGETLASLKDDYEIHKSDNILLRQFAEQK